MTLFHMAGIAFLGVLIPISNPEIAAVLAGRGGLDPVAVGVAGAAGQCVMYLVVYFAGAQIVPRLKWISRQVERTRARYSTRLEKAYLATAVVAALVGVPPMVALIVLAHSFRVSLLPLVAIAFTFRVARFAILAAGGLQMFAGS